MKCKGFFVVLISLFLFTVLINFLHTPLSASHNPFVNAGSEDTSVSLLLAAQPRTNLSIQRIELYFENRRADTTVMRDFPDLKAFADVTFTGSGLLQGYWQVDGRILSYVNQNLTFGGRITIQTPETPPVPTFDTGSHVVKFVITNPPAGMPLPSILYFVTAAEFKGGPITIKVISPSDKSVIEYGAVTFKWEKVSTLSTYSIQFYEDPRSKPVFSLCTDNASYAFSEGDLKKIFSPDRKYYWIVKGCGTGEGTGESVMRSFKFKTGSKNTL